MFGGSSQGQLLNDVWLFDLLKRQWSQMLPAQPDRYAASDRPAHHMYSVAPQAKPIASPSALQQSAACCSTDCADMWQFNSQPVHRRLEP